jgi:hypothetical protein
LSLAQAGFREGRLDLEVLAEDEGFGTDVCSAPAERPTAAVET